MTHANIRPATTPQWWKKWRSHAPRATPQLTLPCAMTKVRWPSPPLPINTWGGGAGKGGKRKEQGKTSKLRKPKKKKRNQRGQNFWETNLKKKKIEKGGTNLIKETGEVYKEAETEGGIFGSKVRKQNHPFRVPSSCFSLSTVAFGHHHPALLFRHHQRCHQQQQRRNQNKTEKEKEQEREQKQRGSKAQRKGDHHLHQRSHRLLLQHDRCVSAPREEEQSQKNHRLAPLTENGHHEPPSAHHPCLLRCRQQSPASPPLQVTFPPPLCMQNVSNSRSVAKWRLIS